MQKGSAVPAAEGRSPRWVTDPALLPALAQANEPENRLLRRQLMRLPARQLDARVQHIAAQVAEAIDCTACANCCKALEPEVAGDEIAPLCSTKSIAAASFATQHLGFDETRKLHFIKPVCPFLVHNRCSVYATRPQSCREYPRLTPDFKFRWRKTWEDYRICPIVFNTVEMLKESLREAGIG
jgi:Fe-S-cluster containining protein